MKEERRWCINKGIVLSGRFLMTHVEARDLYYMICILADGDGICEAYIPMQLTGTTDEELKELVERGLVYYISIEDCIVAVCREIDENERR